MNSDLTNQKFGRLTAKEIVRMEPHKGCIWSCVCECGNEKEVPAAYLRNGHTRSCGCINRERAEKLDITGQRWGKLVAVRKTGYAMTKDGRKQAKWLFQCDCGKEKEMPASNVKHGGVRSCGCMAKEHAAGMRKFDITGQKFGKLSALRPTAERTDNGDILWELACECGNIVYRTINVLKTGRVLSCGCYYKESRKDCTSYRRDLVESTSLSSIVAGKKTSKLNTSGHTGVYFDKRCQKWQAYINFKKQRYYLGSYHDIKGAINARKEAEVKIHDPIVMEYWTHLTQEKKRQFCEYLRSVGGKKEPADCGRSSSDFLGVP